MFSDTETHLPLWNAPFDAQITAATLVAGVWTYDWSEVGQDPSTGAYVAINGGRAGTSVNSPAYEVNGQQVPLPSYCIMRFRCVANGQPIYEFSAGTVYTLADAWHWNTEEITFGSRNVSQVSNTWNTIIIGNWITFVPFINASPAPYEEWWDPTINRPEFYDGTNTWILGLEVTNESGLDLPGCGTIEFLNSTGGITFTISGTAAHVKLVPYVGCTALAAGIIGGVPPAASGQQHYVLNGDGTWNVPLACDTFAWSATPGAVSNVRTIHADSNLFYVGPDPGDSTIAQLTMKLPSGEIYIGGSGGIAAPQTPSGDMVITLGGVTTVQGLQGRPLSSGAPSTNDVIKWSGTAWGPGSALPSLANGDIFVGNVSNVATAVAMSNDATISNTGALTLKTIGALGPIGDATHIPQITTDYAGRVTAMSSVATNAPSTGTLGEFPQWVKISTINYSSFTFGGSTSNTITLYGMPAGGVLHAIKYYQTANWTYTDGGGTSDIVELEIGYSGGAGSTPSDVSHYVNGSFQVEPASGTLNLVPQFNTFNQPDCQNQTGGWNVTITVEGAQHATTSPPNGGAWTIWLLVSKAV